VALQRYQADPSDAAEATPAAEQERWEAEQQKRTRLGGGNREVLAEAAAAEAEKYEMLFDDSIEYVKVRRHFTGYYLGVIRSAVSRGVTWHAQATLQQTVVRIGDAE
jgi:hypothetical protein